ncbi:hypothetical protein K2173_023483 [Erythroxylum novogranatense]|uniref:DUF4216 domain-containing protein n=1 Tax=Erythroxylum novogranatense TaxID=1862640 RepID=A0AAV8TYE5_9ROSI|nr:hypothetical protein K2173_023483 [Erythroxylum novogranatense]
MRWHAEHDQEDGVTRHPSDALAWKHFNDTHQHFAVESRNVRLGLSTDGFQPFGQSGQQYSSWPVIITAYNLPPWIDFPALAMLSGWSTAGKLACPHCGNDSDAFYLPSGGKICWFDNHRKFLPPDHPFRRNKYKFMKNKIVKQPAPPPKCGVEILQEIEALGLLKVTEFEADEVNRSISQNFGWRKRSIFWDLPYWKTNMVRHNLDVMHIEKNIRHELHKDVRTGKYSKTCYTLDKQQKERLCEWLKGLKFPDGYVSNLSRCHLPVHLPYEVFTSSKKNVKNKARVEGSICNAYLVEEASTFCGHYFEPHVRTRARQALLHEVMPGITQDDMNNEVGKQFPRWFARYATENPIQNKFISDLAKGPLRTVNSYPVYFVNGYKYHTKSHGHTMSSMNSGVSIQGELMDYYGKIIEILEVEYPALPIKRCVIFKCDWYDPTPNVGTKVHNRYNVVEINFRRRLRQFEPFILAMQARQVCYVPFPSLRRDKADWLAVCKVKPRGVLESYTNVEERTDSEVFQEDVASIHDTITCDDT